VARADRTRDALTGTGATDAGGGGCSNRVNAVNNDSRS
jgi:hypothetical protein